MQEILRISKTAVFAFLEFVKKWSQHFKSNEHKKKTSNLEAIKLSKETQNLPFVNQPFIYIIGLMEFRFGFAHQPVAFEQECLFSSFSAHYSEIRSTKTATKGAMSKGSRG